MNEFEIIWLETELIKMEKETKNCRLSITK